MIYFTFEKCAPDPNSRHRAGITARNKLFTLFGIDESDAAKTEGGKPYLKSERAGFSISHCSDMAVCALKIDTELYGVPDCVTVIFENSGGINIGCDIEKADAEISEEKMKRISERFLGTSLTDKKQFMRGWTRGEAYGKYTGEGIADAKNIDQGRTFYTLEIDAENDKYIFSLCL